jgi:hypothetical protein
MASLPLAFVQLWASRSAIASLNSLSKSLSGTELASSQHCTVPTARVPYISKAYELLPYLIFVFLTMPPCLGGGGYVVKSEAARIFSAIR